MSVNQEFKVDRDQKNEVIRAQVRVSNATHHFTLDKGMANWRAFSEIRFFENNKQYLLLRFTMSVPAEVATMTAEGTGKRLEMVFDFSKYDATHNVFLSGSVDGQSITGTFDPRTNKLSGHKTSIDVWLPGETKQRLKVFSPVFNEMKAHYDAERKPYEETINRVIHNSRWASVGRAACWGFAGVGAAAACAGTFGLGCVAGAFGFGAAASVCNDQY
ncbi:MAG TPA: hypothetical protein VF297_04530 [Pyrinomonadaceae bacterium]